MSNYAGLKVKIGLKTNGHADYPNFNVLQSVKDGGMDWTKYIEMKGKGWIYDKKSGHTDDNPNPDSFDDSPSGMQIGLIIVDEQFVEEAVVAFPDKCERITNEQCELFHDNNCTHESDEIQHDNMQLQNLYYELELLKWLETKYTSGTAKTKITAAFTKLAARAIKALDADSEFPGIKKNVLKKWADRKTKQKIDFIDPV